MRIHLCINNLMIISLMNKLMIILIDYRLI